MEEQAGVVQKAYSLVLQGILFIKLQKALWCKRWHTTGRHYI